MECHGSELIVSSPNAARAGSLATPRGDSCGIDTPMQTKTAPSAIRIESDLTHGCTLIHTDEERTMIEAGPIRGLSGWNRVHPRQIGRFDHLAASKFSKALVNLLTNQLAECVRIWLACAH
jgi:hypothetical protein